MNEGLDLGIFRLDYAFGKRVVDVSYGVLKSIVG